MNEQNLGDRIEEILVARNLRHMADARAALPPGYYLRAADLLRGLTGNVVIGTGFPVARTFETDGPVGAMVLYQALHSLGAQPLIACDPPLSNVLASHYRVLELAPGNLESAQQSATAQLVALEPEAIIAIERPGLAADAHYYNMRGDVITGACSYFDPYFSRANCPTIAIGDGGNEIGMGNIATSLAGFEVPTSVTCCDELLLADVSNWGAYGLVALLAYWSGHDLLAEVSPQVLLEQLVAGGGVDGVTAQGTPTEDGLEAQEGLEVIGQLRALTGFSRT